MLKETVVGGILLTALTLGIGMTPALTQEASAAKPASESAEPGHAYQLDFTVSEMEEGKKINSRQYSMNLNAGDQDEMKIGTRVPVEPKNGEFQYLDVGTSIWCRLRDRRDIAWLTNDVMMNVRTEISNFAVPEQQGQSSRPIIRQMKIDASTIAMTGKPMVIGAVDDPNAKRQFQLEVMVSRLR